MTTLTKAHNPVNSLGIPSLPSRCVQGHSRCPSLRTRFPVTVSVWLK